jgi:hypothetical protein
MVGGGVCRASSRHGDSLAPLIRVAALIVHKVTIEFAKSLPIFDSSVYNT